MYTHTQISIYQFISNPWFGHCTFRWNTALLITFLQSTKSSTTNKVDFQLYPFFSCLCFSVSFSIMKFPKKIHSYLCFGLPSFLLVFQPPFIQLMESLHELWLEHIHGPLSVIFGWELFDLQRFQFQALDAGDCRFLQNFYYLNYWFPTMEDLVLFLTFGLGVWISSISWHWQS